MTVLHIVMVIFSVSWHRKKVQNHINIRTKYNTRCPRRAKPTELLTWPKSQQKAERTLFVEPLCEEQMYKDGANT